MDGRVLQEQMRYYRERAAEYDATVLGAGDDDATLHPLARELRDGRQFQIVKIYRSPQHLTTLCMEAGFAQVTAIPGTYFFGLIAQ